MMPRILLPGFFILSVVACDGAAAPGAGVDDDPTPPPGDAVEHRVVTVVEGLEHPWGMAFLPDGGILVTERPGRLRIVRDGVLETQPVSGVPAVRVQGQGGLLDVALHPDFATNQLVYLSYAKAGPGGGTTAVARGRLVQGSLVDVHDIFVADAWGAQTQHYGSRIVFDADGTLLVSVGERGQQQPAQSVSDHVGTTVRLNDDGLPASDNPFVGDADARDEIYSIGHRNVQGMTRDPESGVVWKVDHGPGGGDELHVLRAGANYGWPDYSSGNHYDGTPIPDPEPGAGVEMPVAHWTPAIAPSGITVYRGDVFPQWRGDLFIGSLVGRHLRRVRVDDGTVVEQERLLEGRNQRIRDVRTGPDGMLYLLVDAPSAPLLRIEPAP